MARTRFDERYYARFYCDPKRRVASPEQTARLCRFVCAYLEHLEIPVRTALDLGCGLGWWKAPLEQAIPGVKWTGVERSEHLCQELGWSAGSVESWDGPPVDLVICQGVLQYVRDRDLPRAMRNLARLSARALYLEAVTEEDWRGILDRRRSDRDIHVRPAHAYRSRLARSFVACGGGLFVKKEHARLFALERA